MKISNIPHFATCECDGEIEESARGGILGQYWLAQIWKGGKMYLPQKGETVLIQQVGDPGMALLGWQ